MINPRYISSLYIYILYVLFTRYSNQVYDGEVIIVLDVYTHAHTTKKPVKMEEALTPRYVDE